MKIIHVRLLPALATIAAIAIALGVTRANSRAQSNEIATPAMTLPVPDDIKSAAKPKSVTWASALVPAAFQKNPVLDFVVITEMTDDGRKLPPPSFEKPVYYLSHSNGQQDRGDAYAGKNEMTFQQLERRLLQALASAGYRPTDDKHPPSQVLVFTWGVYNRIETSLSEGTVAMGGDDDGTARSGASKNEFAPDAAILSRAQLVGGKKFAEELEQAYRDQAAFGGRGIYSPLERFKTRDALTNTLVEQVRDDCYYMTVSSYDASALAKSRKKILLWRTKMSTSAQGVSLDQTMPGMLENGAYYLGRDMPAPEVVTKRILRKGRVEIGEATVEVYISGTTEAPADAKSKTHP